MKAKKLKAEVVVIGEGCGALMSAIRVKNMGYSVILLNPSSGFQAWDLRPRDGLSIWHAAYRNSNPNTNFSNLWDSFQSRLTEAFPVSIETVNLKKVEHWTILSNVPVHQNKTLEAEEEFLRLERKPWAASFTRLVRPELLELRSRKSGLKLSQVALVQGGVERNFGAYWKVLPMVKELSEFVFLKNAEGSITSLNQVSLKGKIGRRILCTQQGEDITVEYQNACLIFLTGNLLPHMKVFLKNQSSHPSSLWLNGVRKRRRERHFSWFKTPSTQKNQEAQFENAWFQLGKVSYQMEKDHVIASWSNRGGPDGLDLVVDEGLRLSGGTFSRTARCFELEWEWKSPQWRETPYNTHWATAYEGDLWSLLELLWNQPL